MGRRVLLRVFRCRGGVSRVRGRRKRSVYTASGSVEAVGITARGIGGSVRATAVLSLQLFQFLNLLLRVVGLVYVDGSGYTCRRIHPSEVQLVIRRALKEGRFAMRQLAEDSGLSYASLRAWSAGDRVPQPESLRQLAAGLRKRCDVLRKLADELEKAAAQEE